MQLDWHRRRIGRPDDVGRPWSLNIPPLRFQLKTRAADNAISRHLRHAGLEPACRADCNEVQKGAFAPNSSSLTGHRFKYGMAAERENTATTRRLSRQPAFSVENISAFIWAMTAGSDFLKRTRTPIAGKNVFN
jgi:hypothetical protein